MKGVCYKYIQPDIFFSLQQISILFNQKTEAVNRVSIRCANYFGPAGQYVKILEGCRLISAGATAEFKHAPTKRQYCDTMTSTGGARDCGWRSVFLPRCLSSNQKWLSNPFSSTRMPFKDRDRNYAMSTRLNPPPPSTLDADWLLLQRRCLRPGPSPSSAPTEFSHPSPAQLWAGRPGMTRRQTQPRNFKARAKSGTRAAGSWTLRSAFGSEPQETRCLR